MTLASLLLAVARALAALTLLRRAEGHPGFIAAGLLLSLGIATMHVTGMQGVHIPGTFIWHPGLVVAAVLLGSALTCASLLMLRHQDGSGSLVPSATLLAGASPRCISSLWPPSRSSPIRAPPASPGSPSWCSPALPWRWSPTVSAGWTVY